MPKLISGSGVSFAQALLLPKVVLFDKIGPGLGVAASLAAGVVALSRLVVVPLPPPLYLKKIVLSITSNVEKT